MRALSTLLTSVVLLTTACGEFGGRPRAKVTAKVVDVEGNPISGAKVVVLGSYGHLEAPIREGISNDEGFFTTELASDSTLSFQAEAFGFYPVSRMYYEFGDGQKARKTGNWEPWNPTVTVMLRPKGDPIPMFVHRVEEKTLPQLNAQLGFDLVIGDWVAPYGDGRNADFILRGVRSIDGLELYSDVLQLTFSNEGDGLIEVRQRYGDSYGLHLPAVAPEEGYLPKWEWRPGSRLDEPANGWSVSRNNDQDNNYYLRVRTKLDENGNVESALYGKIYKGVGFGNATYPEKFPIKFLYYINPDGSRNTECDVTQNLNTNAGIFTVHP